MWHDELELTTVAIDSGFDSVWATEHHFTDFEMSPSPLQFLSWVCGRAPGIDVGTMVLVLPWHDPLRIIEEVVVLDHLADGRFTLGIGRGFSAAEYEGLRIPMNEASERFDEIAEIVLAALETGRIEQRPRTYYDLPARDVRPAPLRSLRGRLYGAPSVASTELMARLGSGLLLTPRKSLEENAAELSRHAAAWAKVRPDTPPPPPILNQFVYVHEDSDHARTSAHEYLAAFSRENDRHHARAGSHASAAGSAIELTEFIARTAWGTPEQVVDKLAPAVSRLRPSTILAHAFFGGMTRDAAEQSLRLFAEQVIPALAGGRQVVDAQQGLDA